MLRDGKQFGWRACVVMILTCWLGVAPMLLAESDRPVRLEDLQQNPDRAKSVPKKPDEAKSEASPADQSTDRPAAKQSPTRLPDIGVPATKGKSTPVISPKASPTVPDNSDKRLIQPNVPVTLPSGRTRRGPVKPQLPADGLMVVRRSCSIVKDKSSGYWKATFVNTPGQQYVGPRLLLPCRMLEAVEKTLAKTPKMRFRLSGETTNDGKRAYLMIRRATLLGPASEKKPDKPAVKAPKTDSQDRPAPKEDKTSVKSDGKDAPQDSSTSSLIEAMKKKRTGKGLRVASAPKRSADENVSTVAPAGKLPQPGQPGVVLNRLIRVVEAKSGWYEIRFESDNNLREPPMRILPNQMQLRAILLNNVPGKKNRLLEISGEVFYYQKRRYIMLRKVVPYRDMDQF